MSQNTQIIFTVSTVKIFQVAYFKKKNKCNRKLSFKNFVNVEDISEFDD